jgi:hypothetical protein
MKVYYVVLIVFAVAFVIDVGSTSMVSNLKYRAYQQSINDKAIDRYEQKLHELMLKAGLNKKRRTSYGVNYGDFLNKDYADQYPLTDVGPVDRMDAKTFKIFRRMLQKKLEDERNDY